MKVRPPKSYTRLPPSEQKIIEDMLKKQEAIDAKSMAKIFRKNGFPQAMMEKAMGTVELVEPSEKHTEDK